MSQDDTFKKLERRAYLTYHQDGLLDLTFGVIIIGIGLIFLTDGSVGFFLSWMPFVVYLSLKRSITVPRLGYVEFRLQRSRKDNLFTIGFVMLLAIVVGGIFLLGALSAMEGTSSEPGDSIDQYIWMAISGVGAVLFVGAVLAIRVRRLVLYSTLTAIMVIAGFLLDLNPAIYLIILGAVVFITGLVMLVRFLRKYPPQNKPLDGWENHATS